MTFLDSLFDNGFEGIPLCSVDSCPYPPYDVAIRKKIVPNSSICLNCDCVDGFGIVCCDLVKILPGCNYYMLPDFNDLSEMYDHDLLNIVNIMLGRV